MGQTMLADQAVQQARPDMTAADAPAAGQTTTVEFALVPQ